MKKTALALATAATIGVSAMVAPSPAQAWRGGWGWGGWGGGLAAGLVGAAVVGGSSLQRLRLWPRLRLLRRTGLRLLWRTGLRVLWRLCPCVLRWVRSSVRLCSRILRRIWIPTRGSPGIRILRPSVLSPVSLRLVTEATGCGRPKCAPKRTSPIRTSRGPKRFQPARHGRRGSPDPAMARAALKPARSA
jgi:hypothetical protein